MKVYKKDSKGKIRFAKIQAIAAEVHITTGLIDGKATTKVSAVKAKNIGKTNETCPIQQAQKEAEARITKKLKEGYFNTIKEAEEEVVILPMLAKVYEKEFHKIDWNTCYVQPKLDGMRCLDLESGKISRKNTPITTMTHIVVNRPGESKIPVDGELYAPGYTFQENMKFIKKFVKPLPVNVPQKGSSIDVKFNIYDVISELPFIDRYAIASSIAELSTNVNLVETHKVTSEEEIIKWHKDFLEQGYEGTMVRWGNEGYKVNGRSSNLLKLKDFHDITCLVVDVDASEKDQNLGLVVCTYNNKIFGCGMKFSHKEREEILTNKDKYIGKMAEIRFFEFTDGGLPRFPICVGFRLDK